MSPDLSLLPLESASVPPDQATGERASLYRAYRSRTFAEVAGQQHVTRTLRNAVIHDKVGHAYLFTGPRGTGKTSTARILARAVNCLAPVEGEPCNQCTICLSMLSRRSLDVIEIDGASNNSVDDVRELRDRVQFRPAEARRKVFIIDEVHMLSIGAFNALLKTLEEPPDHVLFLLATTEIHKVPATVLSRCQRLDLRPVPPTEMVARLRYICDQEGMKADDAVLELLAGLGTGSLRDALSLLEQVRAYCGNALVLPEVEAALGVARLGEIAALADLMAEGNLPETLLLLGTLIDSGIDPRQLSRQLNTYWRDALLARARRRPVAEPNVARCTADRMITVLRSLLAVESAARRSDSPRFALELAVAEATLQLAGSEGDGGRTRTVRASQERREEPAVSPVAARRAEADDGYRDEAPEPPPLERQAPREPTPAATARTLLGEAAPIQNQPASEGSALPREEPPSILPAPAPADAEAPNPVESWPMLLRWLKEHGTVTVQQCVQKALRQAITVEDDRITLPFLPSDKFARDMLEQSRNRLVLEQAVREVYGGRWGVRCVTISEAPRAPKDDDQALRYLEEIAAELGGDGNGPRGA